ncbi:Helix-turn-helix domain-containing protein [Streptacidiphilus jiangxiensis]|uniref:Helix-turn-helix domain-containing protein n=2 Tax=Streptacidiphilus jiangxiensis TaxID=235985 RepID=A0A1H7V388_STRJI|nr:Helix-turn-helix domain-containing protein [Streptacidiphilus jiangxiensis]
MAGFRDRGDAPVDLRVVPHPTVTLALVFGPGTPLVDDPAGGRHRGSFVAGLGTGSAGEVRVRGEEIAGVQVRLSPAVAFAALGVSPDELSGAVVTLDELWGREAARIRERLDEAPTWQHRFALTEELLARRCAEAPPAHPEVVWSWRRIVAGRGLVRVEELAAEVGWSRKRLWSRFQAQIGLPPKRAANLVRFDHAVHRLAAGDRAGRVAAESGYADQSHLHRDIAIRTGATPATVPGSPWLAVDALKWGNRAGNISSRPGRPPL